MISEAITSLKERTELSQYAISKFIEKKHKAHLPGNFKKLLLVHLRKLTADGKLTKVMSSYKDNNRSAKPVAKKPVTASTEPSSDTIYVVPAKLKPVTAKLKKRATKQKSKVAASAKPAGPKRPVQTPKKSKLTTDKAAPAKFEPVTVNLKKKKTTMKKLKPAGSAKPDTDTLKGKNATVKPKSDAVKPKEKRAAPKPKMATKFPPRYNFFISFISNSQCGINPESEFSSRSSVSMCFISHTY